MGQPGLILPTHNLGLALGWLQIGFKNYDNNHFYYYIDSGQPELTPSTCESGIVLGRPSNRVLKL
jgi:hypothetical protein